MILQNIPPHVSGYIALLKWVIGVLSSGLFALVGWAVRRMWSSASDEWTRVTSRLERIETIQGVTAENHLTTIQTNTAKTVEVLEDMKVGQAELNGYLRGILNKES